MILPRLENFISPPNFLGGGHYVTGLTYIFFLYIYIIYFLNLVGFPLEILWRHRSMRFGSKSTIYLQELLQCPRGLKIAFALLQSKKNFITLYSDGNLPYFISFQEYLKVNETDYLGHTTVFPQYLFWTTVYKLILQIRRIHYYYIPSPGKSHWQVLNTTPPPPNREKSLFAPRHWFSVNLFP